MSKPYMPRDFETMANVLESAYGAGANRGVAAEMLRQGGAQAAEIDRLTAQVREAEARWEALKEALDGCNEYVRGTVRDLMARLEREPQPARKAKCRMCGHAVHDPNECLICNGCVDGRADVAPPPAREGSEG